MAILEIHDASPDNSLVAIVKNQEEDPRYRYQIEMWIEDTKDHDGPDGKPVRWDLRAGTKEAPGNLLARWERQADGNIIEVEVAD